MDCEFEIPMDDYPPIQRPRRPRRLSADGHPVIRSYAPQAFRLMYWPVLILAVLIAIPLVIAARVRAWWDWWFGD